MLPEGVAALIAGSVPPAMRFPLALLRLTALTLVTVAFAIPSLGTRLVARAGAPVQAMWWGSRLQWAWGRSCLWVLGVRVVADGPRPAERAVVAANHLSYLDIMLLGGLCPCRFVAKSEIAGWPLIGVLSRSVGTLFIQQARRRDLQRVGAAMEETLKAGVSIGIFPEGGASRGARIERVHSSLFESLVGRSIPCWAVSISYRTPADPWGEAWTVCWWGGMQLWRHLWRMAGLRGIEATVRWRQIETAGRDRKEITRAVQRALEEGFTPIRQHPVPADCPWPELVALPLPPEDSRAG